MDKKMSDLNRQTGTKGHGEERVVPETPQIIIHADMDSFYASIEAREHPEMAKKPVVVGADPQDGFGRGVVCTCSYEARKYGIHSAMPISRAFQLCPDAYFLSPDFSLYEKVSSRVMEIMKHYPGRFEQAGIDEAFLDFTHTGSFANACERAMLLKEEIRVREGLTCSIGIATGKILAKIASDFRKPDGLTAILPDTAREFLAPLPVEKIPGVGKKTAGDLHGLGIYTIGDLASADIQHLIGKYGRSAAGLQSIARGEDWSGIETRQGFCSVSRETTFDHDTSDTGLLILTLDTLAQDLSSWCDNESISYRTVTIKLRYEGFITRTRARTFARHTTGMRTIQGCAWQLFRELYDGRNVRLIGIRLSGLRASDRKQKRIGEFHSTTQQNEYRPEE
ncbi:MAG: DNA polymerase IV [Methanoregulaceae archaeon]|nr:DNA polymerase IV [Methanoregulaceae archaeon]